MGPDATESLNFFVDHKTHSSNFLAGRYQEKLHALAAATSKICILELFEAAATICRLRDEPWRRKLILSADEEAACAALTTGAAKSKVSPVLVYAVWGVADRYDVAF